MPMAVELKGFDELERQLTEMPRKIQARVERRALRTTANRLRDRLRAGTPVGKGLARRKVNVKVRVNKYAGYAAVRYKDRPALYMRIYDQGDKRQKARPFFESVIGDWKPETIAAFGVAVREAVETHGGAA